MNEPSCAEEIELVRDLVLVWCRTEELSTLWMTYCIQASRFEMLFCSGAGVPYAVHRAGHSRYGALTHALTKA
jgi:hypothetical protein